MFWYKMRDCVLIASVVVTTVLNGFMITGW